MDSLSSPEALRASRVRPLSSGAPDLSATYPVQLHRVGTLVDDGHTWRVFADQCGKLWTFDDSGDTVAQVVAPEAVQYADAWDRAMARRLGVELPIGGAR